MQEPPGETRLFVVMSGFPGSGKSTMALAIGEAFHIPVVSVDPIESAIVEAGIGRSFQTLCGADPITNRYRLPEVVRGNRLPRHRP
jgi:dephospho-CoA kinase